MYGLDKKNTIMGGKSSKPDQISVHAKPGTSDGKKMSYALVIALGCLVGLIIVLTTVVGKPNGDDDDDHDNDNHDDDDHDNDNHDDE